MKKLLPLLACLVACGPAPKPSTAPIAEHSLTVHVVLADHLPVPGPLVVRVVDPQPNPNYGRVLETNSNGDVGAALKQAGFTLCVTAPPGYRSRCEGVTLTSDATITIALERDTPPTEAIHLEGARFVTASGRAFRYRFVTAFDLLDSPQRDAFLDWAKARGFTGVRVLTTASITARIPPGAQGIPQLLADLKARGLGAELVGLADTRTQGMGRDAMRAHLTALAAAIAGSDLPLTVEIANENAHPSQQPDLQDPAFLRELRAIFPRTLPVSLGSTCCGQADTLEPYPGGDYVTLHLDRERQPFWNEVRRVKDYFDTQRDLRRLIVDDEPMGAAEAPEPGRRSSTPERFFAQGLLDRLGELGGTFHCSDCIAATLPGPVQDACAKAYVSGATVVPDDQRFAFANDSTAGAATSGADWSHVQKLFTFTNTTGGPSYLVALNVTGDFAPKWANGWRAVGVKAQMAGVQLIEIAR